MNELIEIQESVLSSVMVEGSHCSIELRPAWVHRSYGRPGMDPGRCYTQDVRIDIGEGLVRGQPASLPVVLLESELHVGDAHFPDIIPSRFTQDAPVRLRFGTVVEDSFLEVEGRSISIYAIGEPTFACDFPS